VKPYQQQFAALLARTGALFFARGLVLKDGRPTPYFVNSGRLNTGQISLELGIVLADFIVDSGYGEAFEVVLGPSYKGSALAQALSIALWQKYGLDKGFEYDRKEAKTHGESSLKKSLFVNGALYAGCRVLLVDDVGTSMATKLDLLAKLRREADRLEGELPVSALVICVDREQTTAVRDEKGELILGEKGEDALKRFSSQTNIPVLGLTRIRELMNYLYRQQVPVLVDGQFMPFSKERYQEFQAYMDLYGS
jgi:orotate phosphoribosyltransferase